LASASSIGLAPARWTPLAVCGQSFQGENIKMYALQCKLPDEPAWTSIYYDAQSKTREEANKRLESKKKSIIENCFLSPETEYQIIEIL
jgi:hypothetical protein